MRTALQRPTWQRLPVLLGVVLAVALGTAVCSAASTTRTGTNPPGSSGQGRLVDIGGRRLYLACRGTAAPTVVFVAGLGDRGETAWQRVSGELAWSTRACVYDRAGPGRSNPSPTPAGYQAAVVDLHLLLRRGRVPGPYLLAGHSLGGLLARLYAHQQPADVAGVVLVDATPVDWFPTVQRLLPAALLSPLIHNPEGFDLRHGLSSLTPLDRPGVLDRRPLGVVWAPNQPPPGPPASTARELAGRWEAEQARLARLSSANRLQCILGAATTSSATGPSSWSQESTTSCARCDAPRRRQPAEAINSPEMAAQPIEPARVAMLGAPEPAARLEPCAPDDGRRFR